MATSSETMKTTKAGAGYYPPVEGGFKCANCIHYIRGEGPVHGGTGMCKMVEGAIEPFACCNLFQGPNPQYLKEEAAEHEGEELKNVWLAPGSRALGERKTKSEQPRPQSVDKGQYGDEDYQDGKPHEGEKRDWAEWDAQRASEVHSKTANNSGSPRSSMGVGSLKIAGGNSKMIFGFDGHDHAGKFAHAMMKSGYLAHAYTAHSRDALDRHIVIVGHK